MILSMSRTIYCSMTISPKSPDTRGQRKAAEQSAAQAMVVARRKTSWNLDFSVLSFGFEALGFQFRVLSLGFVF